MYTCIDLSAMAEEEKSQLRHQNKNVFEEEVLSTRKVRRSSSCAKCRAKSNQCFSKFKSKRGLSKGLRHTMTHSKPPTLPPKKKKTRKKRSAY